MMIDEENYVEYKNVFLWLVGQGDLRAWIN